MSEEELYQLIKDLYALSGLVDANRITDWAKANETWIQAEKVLREKGLLRNGKATSST